MRHVRCGEEKPNCMQCTKTGRKCDGYSNQSQKELRQKVADPCPAWPTVSPDSRLVLVPGSREERKYIHTFCTQTSPALSGFFTSEIWSRFLPQLSHREPTVRHAVAAVSMMYEQLYHPNASHGDRDGFALEQYTKAIEKFRQQLANPRDADSDSILVTCLLFVCLEMLRSSPSSVLDHIQGGMQILLKQQSAKGRQPKRDPIYQELCQSFHRLSIQLPLFGRPLIPFHVQRETELVPDQIPTFDNIAQARESMTTLMNQGLGLIRPIGIDRITPSEEVNQQQMYEQRVLAQSLYKWNTAFTTMIQKTAKSVGISDPRAPLALQINYFTSIIWILSCLARNETVYDQHFASFEASVAAAEKILALSTQQKKPPTPEIFSLDAEVVPAIYWTAMRCREPNIRRRAIAIISNYPTKEGLWGQGERQYEIAKLVLEIEERPYLHLPVEERIPHDTQRVYEALIFPEKGTYLDPCPVTIMTKPHGQHGPWNTRVECVQPQKLK
ncbi:hypothetical protein PENANT_c001G02047 [Penicillium antarcticum]|uniref:Zn(2)-C6 fungal-type domain-containing protein n=2 Tax=Penicillium antarcticum TaxID=416450 RepID=A0A1V6QPA7_9EURO|nr:hypothetical protein PENANT_c001G02047 [Penicillium antarcticum]